MKGLNKDHFSFKCPMNWDELESVSPNKRFCQECQTNVYDLTNCSLEEVQELQRQKGSICGMVRLMGATTVAASLSMAACNPQDPQIVGEITSVAPEQTQPVKECETIKETAQRTSKPAQDKPDKDLEEAPIIKPPEPMIMGKIAPMERPFVDPNKAS